jgi:hypothetical protein
MKLSRILTVLSMLALPTLSVAQGAAQAAAHGPEAPVDVQGRDSLSQADLKRIAEQIEKWDRVEGKAGVTSREARLRATAMLHVLKVSCVVTDASYRGTAPNDTDQNVYEAACKDGVGYLLFLKKSALTGTACLAADDEGFPVKCVLSANSDSKALVGALLVRNHVQCAVRELKWLGADTADMDHVEVACETEGGFVVRIPRPGSNGQLEVLSCQDAIKQGIACELTRNLPSSPATMADARPNLAWFKEALTRNGQNCQTKRARIIGRESIKRRYLVEFECTDRPEGVIAFVPPAGDAVNAFESMDCAKAATRGIRCEFIAAQK